MLNCFISGFGHGGDRQRLGEIVEEESLLQRCGGHNIGQSSHCQAQTQNDQSVALNSLDFNL